MSEQEFENWLRLLGRLLKLSDAQREEIGQELRDHLETQLVDLMSRGFSRDQAIARALDDMGDAAAVAHELSAITIRRKWIMRTTIGFGVAAGVAMMVSVFLPTTPQNPPRAIGQEEPPPAVTAAVEVPAAHRSVQPTESEANRRVRRQLSQPIDELAFEEIRNHVAVLPVETYHHVVQEHRPVIRRFPLRHSKKDAKSEAVSVTV